MTPQQARWTALAAWYRGAGRRLPWRGSPDPWVVLVSEIMLQQTQVSRVVERFGAFIDRFPTPTALAAASRQDVLAAWSGLGYNRRATRLQDAARQINETGWPTTPDRLRTLPGVGAYTAGAVASFAFGRDAPAVDINVRRVLSRWLGRVLSPAEARHVAADLLPANEAHTWTQAIMDLGSSTCTATDPACHRCPCEPWCDGADIVVRSRPQGRFEGSRREARGAIVRALSDRGRVALADLEGSISLDRLEEAAADLVAEGLIALHDGVAVLEEPLDTTHRGN